MELNNINLDLIINYAMIVGAIILVIAIIRSILPLLTYGELKKQNKLLEQISKDISYIKDNQSKNKLIFSRSNYVEAEERVVNELKEIGKPFIVVLNSSHPMLPETERLAEKLKESYEFTTVKLNTISTLSASDRKDKKDYISIMEDNINSIKLEVNN